LFALSRFNMLAESDERRFDVEMKAYSHGKGAGVVTGAKRAKKVKDPNAPKRPMSAYFYFMADKRDSVRAEQPGLGVADTAKVMGRMWAEMGPGEKLRYEGKSEAAKARYQEEKAAYEAGQGAGADSD
jgi:high mobility group protein B1